MSFKEKSAWVMMLVMLAGAAYYFNIVWKASNGLRETAPPVLGVIIPYVLLIVALSVVSQIVLGIASHKEAGLPADERERVADDKAGHWSGYVLAIGVITGVLHFCVRGDGNLLAHFCFGALMVSQIAEYGLQIFFYRRGV